MASSPELDGDRRARELYHYFQPDNPALLPTDECSTAKSSNKVSPNLVLTALAQLAAIKLGAQRAIISLIDRETLYVAAEASQSLNLGRTDVYGDDGDGLWMGCGHGPVAGTLCEKTITLKSTSKEKYPFFVVNDLKNHPTFCDIPCVAGPPHFRYYAGTPLMTRNGINIGSLYVIDPRPDLSLTDSHKETLGTIADAVIDYMEASRHSLEAKRFSKLLSGLNSFVQGESSFETSQRPAYQSLGLSSQDSLLTPSPHPNLERELNASYFTASSINPLVRSPNQINSIAEDVSSSFDPSAPLGRELPNPQTPKSPQGQTRDRTQQTFQRAANLMRQSLDLGKDGGIVIFDASERAELDSNNILDQEQGQKRKLANIRAMSETESHVSNGVSHPAPAPQIDLYFARRMLHRYRRGGLWYFHQDGTAFSSDEDTASTGSQKDALGLPPPLSAHPQSTGPLREKDLNALKQYFPNATRIIFVPLWDSLNSRWFGGCFGWSCLENRVFSAHVELGGLFGLGSSLMVEYSRIQSQESNKKKDDFISTISHELRSPLHGILAANEFLAEYVESEFARRLLDTIRACGQTLLDTFEQILDFTKINSFESKRHRSRPGSPRSKTDQESSNENPKAQPLRILKLVDVVAIIEDVIESVYSGHMLSNAMVNGSREPGKWSSGSTAYCNGTTEVSNTAKIDVSIDAAPQDWEFVLESGALRRVVMNVVGNALKYTQQGTVSLRLEIQRKAKGSNRQTSPDTIDSPVLVLTVSDTGQGISDEYLRSKIFTPFSQEDALSPGTGLGLALVRDILRSLGGNISIKSQLGVGTTVKMTFPLAEPQHHEQIEAHSSISDPLPRPSDLIKRVRTELEGKALRFITVQDPPSSMPPSNHMIRHYLTEWFGMKIEKSESSKPVNLVVVDERHLNLVENAQSQALILVLCHRASRARSTMTAANMLSSNTVWLNLPCGPHQLARTLLDSVKNIALTQNPGLHKDLHNVPTTHLSEPEQASKQSILPDAHEKALNLAQVTVRSVPDPEFGTEITQHRHITTHNPTHSLPSTKGDSIAKVTHGISRTHISPTTETKDGIKILLVDDNAINLALLEKYISRIKPQILDTAMNGEEAIKAVQNMSSGYKYIFMDMSMPVIDGFEATRAIRSIEAARGEKSPATIIALTGLGSDEHIKNAYAAGVNVFLAKPISFKIILGLVDE
ncbi:hypothetical protein PENANT_c005G02209 [Penicillium antarcticum]|uniref:histidine kinase n=1 Tax=Penicillium antarcticum TaxID=416450 RepID=A0A1V6QF68_9EURO|nr:hypothetical protein PENANT_c005G02209 [Penicillium antarcticum]